MPDIRRCDDHDRLSHTITEVKVLFKAHAEQTQATLETLVHLLQGHNGSDGLAGRVTKLETQLTQTDENIERLVVAVQGKDGNGGLVGRMGKLERIWATVIGVAIAGGAAGAGFAKLLAVIGGG